MLSLLWKKKKISIHIHTLCQHKIRTVSFIEVLGILCYMKQKTDFSLILNILFVSLTFTVSYVSAKLNKIFPRQVHTAANRVILGRENPFMRQSWKESSPKARHFLFTLLLFYFICYQVSFIPFIFNSTIYSFFLFIGNASASFAFHHSENRSTFWMSAGLK
jgi:hypothetical protein